MNGDTCIACNDPQHSVAEDWMLLCNDIDGSWVMNGSQCFWPIVY